MFAGNDQALYDLLAARRCVELALLQTVLAECRATGQSLAGLLIDLRVMDKMRLLETVADHVGGRAVRELPAALSSEVAGLLDGVLARTHGIVPLEEDAGSLTVAAVDPFRPDLAVDLSFVLGRHVSVHVADPAEVQALILRHYGGQDTLPNAGSGDLPAGAGAAPDPVALTEVNLQLLAGQTSVVRFVNLVLVEAIHHQASDIHFEPFELDFRIRYRIDGALRELAPPPRMLALPIISRLKVLANLNIAERRRPQDGRIRLTVDDRAVDLRVSTLPTQFGESVVLRVLDQASHRLELGQLGLPAAHRASLEEIIRRPNGIFLVTGPTGSGKTTTLYSCLQQLNTLEAKLLTIEDPVEYEIDGVMQVPVNLATGLTFARALRTFLRQDPDIVMVGEIRDGETAQIAIQAALTGHLVLATLHTNDAASAITRLVDMGIEPFLLASTVEAVLAQRLLRRICPSCRTPYEPSGALLRELNLVPSAGPGRHFFRGAGCPDCSQGGYRGRLGIFEFLRMTDELRELVGQGTPLGRLRQKALEQGMTPLRDAGLAAILAGDTTVEEVLKYT